MTNILKNNFMIYLVGNLLFGFAQWLVIIILVKFGTSGELGAYSYSIALIAPLILLFSLGFNTLIVTNDDFNRNEFTVSRWILTILLFSTYLFILIEFSDIYGGLLILSIVVGLAKLADNIIDIDFAYHIKNKEHYKVGTYKIIFSTLLIVLLLVSLYLFNNVIAPFIIYSLVVFLYVIIKNYKYMKCKTINIKHLFNLFFMGLPIAVTLFLSSLNTNIPKYFLESYSSIVLVGIFSSLLVLYSAGNTFFFSIYNFLLPRVVEKKHELLFLKKLFGLIVFLGIISVIMATIILPFCIDEIIKLMFNDTFLKYKNEFIIIIISSFLIYISIMFDLFINAFNKFKFNTIVQIISIILILLICTFTIPSLGILGATNAFVAFAVTVCVMKLIYSLLIIRGVKYEN